MIDSAIRAVSHEMRDGNKENKAKGAASKALASILAFVFAVMLGIGGLPISAQASELDDAASKLEDAKNAAQAAQDRKDAADAAVAETQVRIAQIEAVIPEQQAKVADVARSLYKQDGNEFMILIDAITRSDTFSDLIRHLDSFAFIADYRQSVLSASKDTKAELAQQQEALVAEQQEAAEALDQAEAAKKEAQAAYDKAKAAVSPARQTSSVDWGSASGGFLTLSQMKFRGVVNYAGYRYTYYSQSVLPGGGLRIPGRHVEGGCVVDGDGYICVASSTHSMGTIVPTPLIDFPQGKVYDCGCAYGTIDLYVA